MPRFARSCPTLCFVIVALAVPIAQRPSPPGRATTGADAVSNAGASIGGHVTDAESAPIANYSVIVFPTDRSKWSSTARALRMARPAPDGSFEVTGLPPGEYWVAATEPVDGNEVSGSWIEPATLDRLSLRARRVTLSERQRYLTILRLIRR